MSEQRIGAFYYFQMEAIQESQTKGRYQINLMYQITLNGCFLGSPSISQKDCFESEMLTRLMMIATAYENSEPKQDFVLTRTTLTVFGV